LLLRLGLVFSVLNEFRRGVLKLHIWLYLGASLVVEKMGWVWGFLGALLLGFLGLFLVFVYVDSAAYEWF